MQAGKTYLSSAGKTYLPPIKELLQSPIEESVVVDDYSGQKLHSMPITGNPNVPMAVMQQPQQQQHPQQHPQQQQHQHHHQQQHQQQQQQQQHQQHQQQQQRLQPLLPSIATGQSSYMSQPKTHMTVNGMAGTPHANNMLSPPESPDMTMAQQPATFDAYARADQHQHQHQHPHQHQHQQMHQPPQQQRYAPHYNASAHTNYMKPAPAPVYSHTLSPRTPVGMPPMSYHHPYMATPQRYSPHALQHAPISHYDNRPATVGPASMSMLSPNKRLGSPKGLDDPAASNASNNANRYQCPYCQKRFSRPSSLRIHTYSHTGEKPFVCTEPGCGRKFSVQSNMRRHLRVHRMGRPVKKVRYDGEVEGVKVLGVLRGC